MTTDERTIRTLRRHLRELIRAVEQVVTALDAEMKKPSDHERGRRVAKMTNFLELHKDLAKRYGMPAGVKPRTKKA